MVFKLVKWVRKRLHNTFWMFKLRCFIWKETVQLTRSASVSITHAGTRTIHINFILYSPSLYNIGCILVAHTTKCCFCAFNHSDYHNRLTRPDHFNAWLLLFFSFFILPLLLLSLFHFSIVIPLFLRPWRPIWRNCLSWRRRLSQTPTSWSLNPLSVSCKGEEEVRVCMLRKERLQLLCLPLVLTMLVTSQNELVWLGLSLHFCEPAFWRRNKLIFFVI